MISDFNASESLVVGGAACILAVQVHKNRTIGWLALVSVLLVAVFFGGCSSTATRDSFVGSSGDDTTTHVAGDDDSSACTDVDGEVGESGGGSNDEAGTVDFGTTLGAMCDFDDHCSFDEKCVVSQVEHEQLFSFAGHCYRSGSHGFGMPCFNSPELDFDSCQFDSVCAMRAADVSGFGWIGECRLRCDDLDACSGSEDCYRLNASISPGWCAPPCSDFLGSSDCAAPDVCFPNSGTFSFSCIPEFFETVGPGEIPMSGEGCEAGTLLEYGGTASCGGPFACCLPLCDPKSPLASAQCDDAGFGGAECVEFGSYNPSFGVCIFP